MKRLLFTMLIFAALCTAACSSYCPGPDYHIKSLKINIPDYKGTKEAMAYYVMEDDSLAPYMAVVSSFKDGYLMSFENVDAWEADKIFKKDTAFVKRLKAEKIKTERYQSQKFDDMMNLFSEAYHDNDSINLIATDYSTFEELDIDVSNYLIDHEKEYLKYEKEDDPASGMRALSEMAKMLNEQTNKSEFRKRLDREFQSFSKLDVDTVTCHDTHGEICFLGGRITKELKAMYKDKKMPKHLLISEMTIKLKRK